MNKIAPLLFAGLFLVACTEQTATRPEQPESGRDLPTASRVSEAERRSIEVYAAVFRQLVTEDHTFGGGPTPFDSVFIVSGVVVNGGRSRNMWKITEPFSDAVRAGLRSELRALPPLTFVSRAEARRIAKKRMDGGGRKLAVILAAGPIDGDGSRVEVPNSLWCGGLCAQWSTYVLKATDGEWKTTGTTGPIAIS
jgi:hypothetical protein